MTAAMALLRLLRPHQWIKNSFVLIGVIFSHGWTDEDLLLRVLVLTAAFCAVSSAVYVLNDVFDREADRVHPQKRERPIASGAVGARAALGWALVLAAGGVAAAWWAGPAAAALACAYIGINIAYSAGLKHVAILDVFLIAAGFMLRILAGTVGVGIEPSRWLLGCGLLLTLFLGFSKRRAELSLVEAEDVATQRRSLAGYSLPLLDRLIVITAAGAVIGYTLYVWDADTIAMHGTDRLVWTLPFVIYGVFRYLYALYRKGGGADPARDALRDPHLLGALAGWIGLTWWLISAA
jgi:4-hydroxybenzoate polyprenyltransferase